MDLEQAEARRIVEKMLRMTGLAPTQLARKAGLAPSTLNRFVNNTGVKHSLSFRTIKRLASAAELVLTVEAPDARAAQGELSAEDQRLVSAFYEFLKQRSALRDEPPQHRPKKGRG